MSNKPYTIKKSAVELAKDSCKRIQIFLQAIRFDKAKTELVELIKHINNI